mgnify:CR=1 FL=1
MSTLGAKISRIFGRQSRGYYLDAKEMLLLSKMMLGQKERTFIENRIGIAIHKLTDFESWLTTGTGKIWATYRACKIISSCALTATFKIQKNGEDLTDKKKKKPLKPDKDGKIKVDPIDFALGGFIDRPNPFDSWEDLMELTCNHLELVGNAFWLKDEITPKGVPTALFPLLPQFMSILPDKTERVSKYIYKVNGEELIYEPKDILHFRHVHPTNLIMGMGSIEPSQTIYNQYINKGSLEEKFLENGAQLSGVFSREDLDEAMIDENEWIRFKKKFMLEYAGSDNIGKTAFLNGKWTYHKLGMTMAEMQSLEKERWNIQQIFLNHGVPLSLVGIEGAANFATANQDEINFRNYKILPLLDQLVGRINADGFIKMADPEATLTYQLPGLVDVEKVTKQVDPLIRLGIITRNEAREMLGLPLMEDPAMDEITVDGNPTPISMLGMNEPVIGTEAPVAGPASKKPLPAKTGADGGKTPPTQDTPTNQLDNADATEG